MYMAISFPHKTIGLQTSVSKSVQPTQGHRKVFRAGGTVIHKGHLYEGWGGMLVMCMMMDYVDENEYDDNDDDDDDDVDDDDFDDDDDDSSNDIG